MRSISKILLVSSLSAVVIGVACTKKISNQYFGNGTTPVLNSSATTVAATTADSLSNALVLNWTNPQYATDSGSEKYTIQMDSSGRNFAKAVNFVVLGALMDSFSAKTINNVVLGFGASFGVPYSLDVRLVSSYVNNNEQLFSNIITLTVTPYKIPPKVQPPSTGELFLVGDATAGGWSNPVPVPTQQLEEVDSVDYAGVFNLSAGHQYLLLPVNGDWTNKYATNESSPAATGSTFGYNASNNFTGPVTAGWYTIWVNFQSGIISVIPYSGAVPTNLFIVGSATAGGWNNPVPVPSQQLTQKNATQFSVTLPLSAANQYLLLPLNGDWTNKYAVASTNDTVSGGTFGYNGGNANFNTNFTGPTTAGTYTMTFDFLSWTYTVQ